MTAVHCPTCNHPLPPGDPGRRGILINRKAALGARVVELEWQVVCKALASRRAEFTAQLEATKAELAAVTAQLDAETKESQ